MGSFVSVVLPCLNEADSVGLCVKEALDTMSGAGTAGEVVVVDNGSTDGSADVAEEAGARVVTESRRGYGRALRSGFDAARGDVVVMADADFTYDLQKIPTLIAPVVDGRADLVLGSRLDAATRRTMPILHRFVGTPVLSFLIGRACGGRVVGDSQSGFRAFRRQAVLALALQSTGMELASEMLIRGAQAGLRIEEVEAGYRERIGDSKLDAFGDGWRHLQLIFLLAPDLLLVGPGAVLCLLGALLSLMSFVRPAGVSVGSLRWQPVFFSSICLVLGVQALLAGSVLAYRSSVATNAVRQRFRFVGHPAFPTRALVGGLITIVAGLVADVALFVGWVSGDPSPPNRGLALAALAQSLLIVGGSLASFGAVSRFVFARSSEE